MKAALCSALLAAVAVAAFADEPAAWPRYFHKAPGELMARDTPRAVRDDASVACAKTDTPPKIDGKLDDAVWQQVHFNGRFAHYFGYGPLGPKTEFAVCHDDEALYLAIRCYEPDTDGIVTKTEKHDGPVYADDNVEIFLDPGSSRLNYYHLAVNSRGVRFDQFNNWAKWSEPWEAKATVEPGKGWTVECRFPFASFRGKPTGSWGFNLVRTRPRGPGSMPAMWRCGFGFMKPPQLYGRLRFGGMGLTVDGDTIHNASAKRRDVTVYATLSPRGVGSLAKVEQVVRMSKVDLAPGETRQVKDAAALFALGSKQRHLYRRLRIEARVNGKPDASERWRWHTPPVTGQLVWSRLDPTHPRVEARVFLHAVGKQVPLRLTLKTADGKQVATGVRTVAGASEYDFSFARPAAGKYVLTLAAKGGTFEMPFEVSQKAILK